MTKDFSVGVDIGGTKIAVLLGKADPEIIERYQFPTPSARQVNETLALINKKILEMLEKNAIDRERVAGIGVSCGGPLDSKTGTILSPPNLPGWNEVHITDYLNANTGIDAYLENDANAGACAEGLWGAAAGLKHYIFLTFGTGCGAGLVLNGRLYEGARGMAGEVGHIRLERYGPSGYGKAGSFEGFCSGGGIAQTARTEILKRIQTGRDVGGWVDKMDGITAEDVGKAADESDELAIEVFRLCGEYLGKGLSVLIDIFNPERIILGSIFLRCGKYISPAMMKEIRSEALERSCENVSIVAAGLGEAVGDFAALAVPFWKGKRNESA